MRLTVSLLCLSLASWGAAAAPILASSDGPVRGANADGVERFLGIPYAAPPVAEQRWQPPGPVKTHPAVLEATRFGNDCIQNGIPYAGAPKTSEDCLYLNIWRPAGAMHLPIMVYVFGGGFNIGSGAWAMVDGAGLARRGVVLVNFNYRLGKLGYFAHPALTRTAGGKHIGNFGLLDQIAALRWVKRNAKALGGDPGDITIFGESTGGTAVEYLMTAPAARGLFQRAIVESSIGTLPMPSFAEAEKLGERAAAGWGVADADPESLRHVPAATVLGSATMTEGGATPLMDDILPSRPMDAFRAGHIPRIAFVIGSNKDESGFFPDASRGLSKKLAPVWPQATKLYDGFGTHQTRLIEDQVMTDLMIAAPAFDLATAAAKAGLPTYLYRYDYLRPLQVGQVPGPIHFDEVYAVFDTMRAVANKTGPAPQPETPDTRRIVASVERHWTRFATSGDPAIDRDWPRFDAASGEMLVFTEDGSTRTEAAPTARYAFIDALPPMPTPKTGE